jgi:beta-phosphoglucomutase family hydrolase
MRAFPSAFQLSPFRLSPVPLAQGLALIFDLDGVVIDSMPLHTQAWERYLHSLGMGGNGILSRMHGRRNDEIVRDFLGPETDPQTVFAHGAAKERLYRQMMAEQLDRSLVPGVAELLRRAHGAPVALATNAEPANVDFVLDGAGLRDCFQAIVDGTQVEHAKPAPDVYVLAARRLGVDPANCIVFEDSPVGVQAARAAGARVVGVLTYEHALDGVQLAVRDFHQPELELWLAAQRPV